MTTRRRCLAYRRPACQRHSRRRRSLALPPAWPRSAMPPRVPVPPPGRRRHPRASRPRTASSLTTTDTAGLSAATAGFDFDVDFAAGFGAAVDFAAAFGLTGACAFGAAAFASWPSPLERPRPSVSQAFGAAGAFVVAGAFGRGAAALAASPRPAFPSPRFSARTHAWIRHRVSALSETSRARDVRVDLRRHRRLRFVERRRGGARARSRIWRLRGRRRADGLLPAQHRLRAGQRRDVALIRVRSPEYFELVSRMDFAGCVAAPDARFDSSRTASPRRRRASVHWKIARELTEDDRWDAGEEPFLPLSRCSFTSQQPV